MTASCGKKVCWTLVFVLMTSLVSAPADSAELVDNKEGEDWWLPPDTARAPYSGLYWISESRARQLAPGHDEPRYVMTADVVWSEVNPSPGVYDWSSVDAVVQAAEDIGPGAGFGLWPWYGTREQIPQWVLEQYHIVFDDRGYVVPWDPNDQWLEAVTPFIQAMGARYKDHPQLVFVDMRLPTDVSGEFNISAAGDDIALAPAIVAWHNAFFDTYAAAFAGQERKLVNMISSAGHFWVDPGWKDAMEEMLGHSYELGTGERDGFPTNTRIWHAGFGHIVTPEGYVLFDESHPPIVNHAFYGSENTEFDPNSDRFGPREDTPYRYRLAVLWNLMTRRNWLALALYDHPDYTEMAHWAEMELGHSASTARDAWSWPKSSVYGNYYADSTERTTIKNFERWLMQRDVPPDGMTQPTELQRDGMFGRGGIVPGTEYGARRTDMATGNTAMYFKLDRAFMDGGPHGVWLKVTYKDDCAAGSWHLEYSSPTGIIQAPGVQYSGSGSWRTATYSIDDFMADGAFSGGMDFRLVAPDGCDLTVNFVRVIKKEPPSGCREGEVRECGVGACAGHSTCVDGEWTECDGPAPSPEDCSNGIDDDCDGRTDGEDEDCLQPDIIAYHTDGATVDGSLMEYGDHAPLTFSSTDLSDNDVSVWALWDEQYLYLAFMVRDGVVRYDQAERDGDVWSHDGVEIFLDLRHDGGETMEQDDFHFIVDAHGVLWDGRGTGQPHNNGDPAWNSSAVSMAQPVEGGYAMELAIPWEDLDSTPQEGMTVGVLFVNNDLDDGELVYFSHNGTTPWAVPSQWGAMRLCPGSGCDTRCPPNMERCPDGCVDTGSDPENCGECGHRCPSAPHGRPGCSDGVCTIVCDDGWQDCNGDAGDGCEWDLSQGPCIGGGENGGGCACSTLASHGPVPWLTLLLLSLTVLGIRRAGP